MSARRDVARGEGRRVVVLGALALALGVLAVVSATTAGARPTVVAASVARVSLSAESSAFYCAGLEHIPGVVESYVAVADLASTPRIVELTTTNDLQQVDLRQVTVLPGRVFHFTPARLLAGSLQAVSVDANEGGIAVTESMLGVNGAAVAPCLSSTAPSWWVTGGSTEPGLGFVLSIFNPNAFNAVLTVTLSTPSGSVAPVSYRGILLGPHQFAALDLHTVAPNQSPITANVVATDGSVVAYGIERSTSTAPVLSLLPASPSPTTSAILPVGPSSSTVTTKLLLVDPGPTPTTATVHVVNPPGCSIHCAAPFVVGLAPGVATPLTVAPSSRVPSGSPFGMLVRATAPGVVVLERVSENGVTGQSTPVDATSRAGTDHLVLVNPLANGFDAVYVVNASASKVTLDLETVTPSGERTIGRAYSLAANGMLELSKGALGHVVDGVLELVASGPIAASGVVQGGTLGSDVLVAAPT
jgi:hypothetical protein